MIDLSERWWDVEDLFEEEDCPPFAVVNKCGDDVIVVHRLETEDAARAFALSKVNLGPSVEAAAVVDISGGEARLVMKIEKDGVPPKTLNVGPYLSLAGVRARFPKAPG